MGDRMGAGPEEAEGVSWVAAYAKAHPKAARALKSFAGYGWVGLVGWVVFIPFTNVVYFLFGTSIVTVNAANGVGIVLGFLAKWAVGVKVKVIRY